MLLGRVLLAQTIAVQPTPMPPPLEDGVLSSEPQGDGVAEEAGGDEEGIFGLDIEQLRRTSVAPALQMEVSAVSRQPSTVGRSSAAVFVVTTEMIRRSGAQTIPEVLRMVPGLQVAQRDSNTWAVSSRGFNSKFANELLVRIDGRTVYTPVFAGAPPPTQLGLFNDARGHGYGLEIGGDYQATDCWKLTAWYSLLQLKLQNLSYPPQSNDDPERIEGSSPRNQVFLMKGFIPTIW